MPEMLLGGISDVLLTGTILEPGHLVMTLVSLLLYIVPSSSCPAFLMLPLCNGSFVLGYMSYTCTITWWGSICTV